MQYQKESIFKNSIRSFFVSLMAVIGVFIAIFIFAFLFGLAFSKPNYLPKRSAITIAADANGNRMPLPNTAPVIIRLDISGIIGTDYLNLQDFENVLLDSQTGMTANRVKGILLTMNTPGGTSIDSDGIYRALQRYKERYNVPVYAFVDGLCASGGVYISSAADKIYATPDSIIGSVGVLFGPSFNFYGTMEKIGVDSLTLTEGKDKDTLNPFRPWKPGEGEYLKDIVAAGYERFVSIVTQARPKISKEQLVNVYGAKVFSAEKSEEIGFIDDANSDYSQALRELTIAAGIDEGQNYQVFLMQPPHSFFEDITRTCTSIRKQLFSYTYGIQEKPLDLYCPTPLLQY